MYPTKTRYLKGKYIVKDRSRLITKIIRFSRAAKTVSVYPNTVQASDSDGKPVGREGFI